MTSKLALAYAIAMKLNDERARLVSPGDWKPCPPGTKPFAVEVVDRLDAAGLLASPLEQAERELVEAVVAHEAVAPGGWKIDLGCSPTWTRIAQAALAVLAARKPAPRYEVIPVTASAIPAPDCMWAVAKAAHGHTPRALMWTGFTEAQARAVAEALNKLEAAS
jgi:hypothetical protein